MRFQATKVNPKRRQETHGTPGRALSYAASIMIQHLTKKIIGWIMNVIVWKSSLMSYRLMLSPFQFPVQRKEKKEIENRKLETENESTGRIWVTCHSL